MEYDSVLKKIGEFGKFQKQVCFTVCLISFPSLFNGLGYVFWAARLDHWCHVNKPHGLENVSAEIWKNLTIPLKQSSDSSINGAGYDSCTRYNISEFTRDEFEGTNDSVILNFLTNQTSDDRKTLPCESWDYDTQEYTSSIVTKYTLVCDRQWLISLSQSMYMASRIIGTLGVGALADRFGRRPVILLCILLQVASGVAIAFAPSVALFMVFRCFCAIFSTGSFQTIYVYVVEIVGPSFRVFAGTVIMLYWAVAYMVLGVIAYFIRDHFILMLVISTPFIFMIGFHWIMPESPRWLLVKSKKKAALSVISKIAKTNGIKLQEILEDDIITDCCDQKIKDVKSNLCDAFKSPYIWKMTAVLAFIWFTNAIVYYGLSLNTSDLGGNDHFNFFIAGAVEIPAYVFCYVMFHRFGRQWPLAGMTCLAGLSLLASSAVPSGHIIATVILATLGKFAITCTFSMIYIYTVELYPTSVRNITLGICSTLSRMGGTLAPFAAEVSRFHPGAPLLIFGIIATIASVLVLTLPETQGTCLPQTLEDGRLLAKQPNVFTRCMRNLKKKKKESLPSEDTLM